MTNPTLVEQLRALTAKWRSAEDWQSFGPTPSECADQLEAILTGQEGAAPSPVSRADLHVGGEDGGAQPTGTSQGADEQGHEAISRSAEVPDVPAQGGGADASTGPVDPRSDLPMVRGTVTPTGEGAAQEPPPQVGCEICGCGCQAPHRSVSDE